MSRPKQVQNITVKTLQSVGLNENEALLYTLMLEHPRSTVRELEVRTPFPRTMLYHVLNQLTLRGLVSAKKTKGRTVYIIEGPEHLYDLLHKKETEFQSEMQAVRTLVPKLKKRYSLAGKRPNVRIFEGVEDYKKALEDIIISKPKEVLAYEVLGKDNPGLDVRTAHEKRRIAKKIDKKVLFFENKNALNFLAKRKYDDFTHFRGLSEDVLDVFDTDFIVYDGKILYTNYADAYEPTAVLVEDNALSLMQKNLFLMLWKQAKDRTLYFVDIKQNKNK